jgi:hypothetical protein
VLLLFDTFEKSDEAVQRWLISLFLPLAHNSPNLFMVIAGQRVPEQTFDWDCHVCKLGAIPPHHWLIYAQALRVDISLEMVQRCCENNQGRSLQIAMTIGAFAPREDSV